MGHAHGHDQARLPPLSRGVLHPGLGGRPHLVRDQAAVGRGSQGETAAKLKKIKHFNGLLNFRSMQVICGML